MQDIYRAKTLESGTGNLTRKDIGEMLRSPDVTLVFDFDQTIADTAVFQRPSYSKAVSQILGRQIEISAEFAKKKELRGKDASVVCKILLEEFGGISDEEAIKTAVLLQGDALMDLLVRENVLLMDGIDDIVRLLRKIDKKAGVASQSPDDFIDVFLQRAMVDDASIQDVFPQHAVVGRSSLMNLQKSGRQDVLFKPSPFSIFLAADKISRDKKHVLYVGDNAIDARCVIGEKDMTGLIVNNTEEKRSELVLTYGGQRNIVIVGSMMEVL